MPSPLGHAVGGVAIAWAVSAPVVRSSVRASPWRSAAWFAALGALPDADLLVGSHRAISHSIGAALIVSLAAAALTRQGRLALAAGLAYASHALLDWLSEDTSVPLGVMALWPLSTDYYLSGVTVFDSIWRRKETPDFWSHNAAAVARELLILLPLLGIVLWWRRSALAGVSTYRSPGRSSARGARPRPSAAAADRGDTSDRPAPRAAPRESPGRRRAR